jgi:Zn-dependent protease
VDSQRLFATAVAYLVLLLSLSAREAFKAWTAELCGDSTARVLGRVSLNPVRHLDIFGSLILPAVLLAFGMPVFGWGRPVPIFEKNLRDPYRGGLLVAAAGPFCSFTIGLLAALALLIAVAITGTPGKDAATWALFHLWDKAAGAPHFPLMFTLTTLVTVNAFLTVFHLIPLPPLDGGRLAVYLLPQDWAEKLAAIRPSGFMIGIVLALFIVVALVLPLFFGILSVLIQFFA